MKEKISNLQFMFFAANFIFTSAVISLPQIIVQVAGQNGWLVPIITFPLILVFLFLIFGKKDRLEYLTNIFVISNKGRGSEKAFLIFFVLMAAIVFIQDLRGLIDFIATYLLPSTPIDMLMVLTILVTVYIAMAGLEVIARMNMIDFVIIVVTIIAVPFLLLNEWEFGNLQPFPNLNAIPSIITALYFSFAWVGELFLFLIMVANIQPVQQARKAALSGAGLGLFLFFLVMFSEIAVLHLKITRESVYPTHVLIQQIHMTDFLDRLDLVIIVLWIPTIIVKEAYLLYAINHCFSYFYKSNTNKFLLPIAFILGFLSILLFKNTMDYLHFSFYTWSALGIVLEFMLIFLFLIAKRQAKRKASGAG